MFEIATEKKTPYITPSSVSMDQLPLNKRTKLKSLLESEGGRAKSWKEKTNNVDLASIFDIKISLAFHPAHQ